MSRTDDCAGSVCLEICIHMCQLVARPTSYHSSQCYNCLSFVDACEIFEKKNKK